jgi:hypothetical protein
MDFSGLFKQAGKVAAKNSPAILTAIGVSGVLSTAILAAQAAFKSVDVLKEAEEEKRDAHFTDVSDEKTGEPAEQEFEGLTRKEQVNAVWQLYIPAAISAGMTVTAIVFSAHIQDRRNAALASAYTFAEKSLKEYRESASARLGKKKEQEVRDEIAQRDVTNNPPKQSEIILVNDGNVLCRDAYSRRYFNSDMESLRRAENDLNWQVLNQDGASLTDYYHAVGLEKTSGSDDTGWNHDNGKIEFVYSTALTENDRPCIVVSFREDPEPKYFRRNR